MTPDNKIRLPKRLYSFKDASVYLGRSEWVIASMVREGLFSYVPHGRRKLLDVKDLDQWIDRAKVNDAD